MLNVLEILSCWSGAYEQEHATPPWLYFCHSVFVDRFIFKSNLLWMRLPWECHNQSQDTNWRHRVTGPELPFFHKRKGVLKIDQSVKMPWHRLSMGVSSSCSSAPGWCFGQPSLWCPASGRHFVTSTQIGRNKAGIAQLDIHRTRTAPEKNESFRTRNYLLPPSPSSHFAFVNSSDNFFFVCLCVCLFF